MYHVTRNIFLVALVFLAAGCNRVSTVNINGHIVNVEIAETSKQRELGLSGRQSLASDAGMLFVFEEPDRYGFWMKDMNFPLDFIWIKDSKVIEITSNVPETNLNIYKPKEAVDKVLEVNAGWASKNQINIGDSISYN